jgi:oligopeptide transport system substrate-binding protein
MQMISDSNTAMNVFDDGACDMIGISGDYVQTYKDNGVDVKEYGDGSTWYFEFNTTLPGLNNAKVRKALTYAYDVPQFVEKLIKNGSADSKTFTPKAINGGDFAAGLGDLYNRTYDDKQWADAKALLEEGLKEEGLTVDEFSLTILGDVSDTAKKNYEYFQAQWQDHLGIKVDIQQVEFQDRLDKMDAKDFGVVFAGWGPDYDDPMTFLDLWVTDGGNNHTSWSNAEYDECVAKALVEADAAKRLEYLKRCEEIIAEEFPIGVIYERSRSYVTSERLHGVIRNAFSDIDLTEAYTE